MDFQSAMPAFLLLGSAVVTIITRMRSDPGASEDQLNKNRWVIGFSLAIIAAVTTFVISQTGTAGTIVSEDQYMLAMLIATVFLLIYYVCSGGCDSSSPVSGNFGMSNAFTQGVDFQAPDAQMSPMAMTDGSSIPQAFATRGGPRMGNNCIDYSKVDLCKPINVMNPNATCCGGDRRNIMINSDCGFPEKIPPPVPPCIDNVYNESCYSKPYVPPGAIPNINSDEMRRQIKWDRRIDCPKHKSMIFKGDYPFSPSSPNWQNSNYIDSNALMWYGQEPGYAPLRDSDRNILGQPLPSGWTRTGGPRRQVGGYGINTTGNQQNMLPFMQKRQNGNKKRDVQEGLRRKIFYNQNQPKWQRFTAPDISYQPQPYITPDNRTGGGGSDVLARVPVGNNFATLPNGDPILAENPCTCGMEECMINEAVDGCESKDIMASNWRTILVCSLILILHRCYRNVTRYAKHHGKGRHSNPFYLIGENPMLMADAIKQDATLMVTLLSVACIVMFSMTSKNAISRRKLFA